MSIWNATETQDHQPHQRTDIDRIGKNVAAMFDPRPTQDRADRGSQLQQRRAEPHSGGAARQQQHVGRDNGRRVDQAKACHS